ncbi:Hypothetical predicted protein [Octopus vulgaris]|uniref:Uncharacterized protein n=1 Tax=Octopus vulgaris TaxID=6645 RepID=A0AA36AZ30_OCTVU|nr:Hypothetical predicted protein [Octopus vulgaris]
MYKNCIDNDGKCLSAGDFRFGLQKRRCVAFYCKVYKDDIKLNIQYDVVCNVGEILSKRRKFNYKKLDEC